uniref:Uncharacterized protein n=1 Tax=Rhizophora mucronata TaxID=61149 RepID=A0A2P2R5A2_RHIMU
MVWCNACRNWQRHSRSTLH